MTPMAWWVSMMSALSAIEQLELVFAAADRRATLQESKSIFVTVFQTARVGELVNLLAISK